MTLVSILGFGGGRVKPGTRYRRQFTLARWRIAFRRSLAARLVRPILHEQPPFLCEHLLQTFVIKRQFGWVVLRIQQLGFDDRDPQLCSRLEVTGGALLEPSDLPGNGLLKLRLVGFHPGRPHSRVPCNSDRRDSSISLRARWG